MKAIIVLDEMPKRCWDCNAELLDLCAVTRRRVTNSDGSMFDERPDWCPLKEMPKELVYEGYDSPNIQIGEAILQSEWGKKAKKNDGICIRAFSIGWNSCLEEIEK